MISLCISVDRLCVTLEVGQLQLVECGGVSLQTHLVARI